MNAVLAALRIRPGEERKVLAMFFYLFFAVGAFIVGRISRDTLFLELPDAKKTLPFMYLAIAPGVSLSVWFYSRFERRFRRQEVTAGSLLVFAVTVAAIRFSFDLSRWMYWIYYVWVEVFGTLMVIQCWSFANDIFNSREAKRLFAIIGGGGVVSNIAVGFFIKQLVVGVGARNLLWLVVAMIGVAWLLERWLCVVAKDALRLSNEQAASRVGKAGPISKQEGPVLANLQLRLMAAVVVLTFVVSTVVDYQFKIVTAESITQSADRAAYFGTFFGVTGILAAIVQFGLTSRLLERFGVLVTLLLLPLGMLTGSLAMLVSPSLLAASWVKGSENVLRYSVNDATTQLLYVPVPPAQRSRAKSFIDGILKPIAIGFSGLLLLAVSGLVSVRDLSYVALVALFGWAVLLVSVKREYVRSLMLTLRRRRLDFSTSSFDISDDSTWKALLVSLDSPNEGQVLHALDMLNHSTKKPRAARERVLPLAKHASMPIRLAAFKYLGRHGESEDAEVMLSQLSDPHPDIRAAVVTALANLHREAAIRSLEPVLRDPDSRVRAAVLAGLIKHGSLDGILRAAEPLKAMLTSQVERDREAAAWVLGEIRVKNFYQPVLELMNDKAARVRAAAIVAAGHMASPELAPMLIYALEDSKTAAAAVDALSRYGQDILALLEKVMDNDAESPLVRQKIPRILAQIGGEGSLLMLQRHLGTDELSLRYQVLRAMQKLHEKLPDLALDERKILDLVDQELRQHYSWLVMIHDLDLGSEDVLLMDALAVRCKQSLDRIFRLLGLLYPYRTLEIVYTNLGTPQARANAVEILDNILEGSYKRLLIALVEDNPAQTLAVGRDTYELPQRSRREYLSLLLDVNDPWLVTIALHTLCRDKPELSGDHLAEYLEHGDALVRETALYELGKRKKNDLLAKKLDALAQDHDPRVRKLAQAIMTA